jgi:PilZ domain
MMPYLQRAERVSLPITIMYRRTGEELWYPSRVVNLSESGVLFGPTELTPGTPVEVMLSPPIQVGSLPTGKQVCSAEVVRATEVGVVAARFEECRFLLES